MYKNVLIMLLVLSIFLAGCQKQVPVTEKTTVPTTSAKQAATSLLPTTTKPVETTILPLVKEFSIEGDDNGLYPSSIAVNAGDKVKITFLVRDKNVYYGGLDFRSSYFKTSSIKPGGSGVVEFLADKTFTYTSYWPKSNVKKADGTIIVN